MDSPKCALVFTPYAPAEPLRATPNGTRSLARARVRRNGAAIGRSRPKTRPTASAGTLGSWRKEAKFGEASAEHREQAGGGRTGTYDVLGHRVAHESGPGGDGQLGGLAVVKLVPVSLVNGGSAFYATADGYGRGWGCVPTPLPVRG